MTVPALPATIIKVINGRCVTVQQQQAGSAVFMWIDCAMAPAESLTPGGIPMPPDDFNRAAARNGHAAHRAARRARVLRADEDAEILSYKLDEGPAKNGRSFKMPVWRIAQDSWPASRLVWRRTSQEGAMAKAKIVIWPHVLYLGHRNTSAPRPNLGLRLFRCGAFCRRLAGRLGGKRGSKEGARDGVSLPPFIGTAFVQDDAEAASKQWCQAADRLRPKVPKLAALMESGENRGHARTRTASPASDPLLSVHVALPLA
jgi:hypothetical protein